MEHIFARLRSHILNARRIAIVTHPRPDGDALGSLCATIGLLKNLKKDYRAFCFDSFPDEFFFLSWSEEVTNNIYDVAAFEPDLLVLLDIADPYRARVELLLSLPSLDSRVIVFDHHLGEPVASLDSFMDPSFSSTAEILFFFFNFLDVRIDLRVASALLLGIITDTENFTNSGTRPETLSVAGQLMKYGANYNKLTRITARNRTFEDLKVVGRALNRLVYNREYGIISTCILLRDKRSYMAEQSSLEGFSNFLKHINVGLVTLVLYEQDGVVKGSLRSISHNINVAKLAQVFGGGGHRLAAGFSISGKLIFENGRWMII